MRFLITLAVIGAAIYFLVKKAEVSALASYTGKFPLRRGPQNPANPWDHQQAEKVSTIYPNGAVSGSSGYFSSGGITLHPAYRSSGGQS